MITIIGIIDYKLNILMEKPFYKTLREEMYLFEFIIPAQLQWKITSVYFVLIKHQFKYCVQFYF